MRLGIGGGKRIARGGISIGRGGVRAGVGSGPFSLTGGFGRGSGAGFIENVMMLVLPLLVALIQIGVMFIVFMVVALASQIQLASVSMRSVDLSCMNSRKSWIWRNRKGILHSTICSGLYTVVGIIGALGGEGVALGVMSIVLGLVTILTFLLTMRVKFRRRQEWRMEAGTVRDFYWSFGYWYISIPKLVKERQWKEIVSTLWAGE